MIKDESSKYTDTWNTCVQNYVKTYAVFCNSGPDIYKNCHINCSPNIITVTESGKCDMHGDKRKLCRILVRKPEEEDNLKGTGVDGKITLISVLKR